MNQFGATLLIWVGKHLYACMSRRHSKMQVIDTENDKKLWFASYSDLQYHHDFHITWYNLDIKFNARWSFLVYAWVVVMLEFMRKLLLRVVLNVCRVFVLYVAWCDHFLRMSGHCFNAKKAAVVLYYMTVLSFSFLFLLLCVTFYLNLSKVYT